MYHFNVNKLNGKIVELNTSKEAVASKIGIDRSTFYRRLKNSTLTIRDIHGICDALSLSREEVICIFFGE